MTNRPTTQTPVMKPRCGKRATEQLRGGPFTLLCGLDPEHSGLCIDIGGYRKFKPTRAAIDA